MSEGFETWITNTDDDMRYWRRVRVRATELRSDGCSGVPDFYKDACLEHDIHYRTHRYMSGDPIDKQTADLILKRRIQSWSLFGSYSPMAWWRWKYLTYGAQDAWDTYGGIGSQDTPTT